MDCCNNQELMPMVEEGRQMTTAVVVIGLVEAEVEVEVDLEVGVEVEAEAETGPMEQYNC